MSANNSKVLPAPKPTKIFFDPFNSSSSGHQTAPNLMSGSTSWRKSRSYKLSHQFRDASGRGGSKHLSDLVGAGSENYRKDGRKDNGDWEKDAPGLREEGWQDIRGLFNGNRKRSGSELSTKCRTNRSCSPEKRIRLLKHERPKDNLTSSISSIPAEFVPHPQPYAYGKEAGKEPEPEHEMQSSTADQDDAYIGKAEQPQPQPPQIFRGLTIYLNGSTAPIVSDHKLKQLFAMHGGNTALGLGRRTVTHVILGQSGQNALSARKMHKEATLVRGKSIKYVTPKWVLDSVDKGIRQPEWKYQPPGTVKRIGGSGQNSVVGCFEKNGVTKDGVR